MWLQAYVFSAYSLLEVLADSMVLAKDKPEDLPDLTWFDGYHSYDEHLEYLDDLSSAFPKNSEVFVAGESLEGREQKGIHIWGKGGKDKNTAILWHG